MSKHGTLLRLSRLLLLLSLVAVFSCNNSKQDETQQNVNKPLPPPTVPFNRDLCDTMKARTYGSLKEGRIQLVYKDTFHYQKQHVIFEEIIRSKFRLDYNSEYQLEFEQCIQPIMDSAIEAKYGINGKDSILIEAYRLTEIEYKKNR